MICEYQLHLQGKIPWEHENHPILILEVFAGSILESFCVLVE